VNNPSASLRFAIRKAGACLVGFADLSALGVPAVREYQFGICFALRQDYAAIDALPEDKAWLEMGSRLADQSRAVYQAAEEVITAAGYRCRKITSNRAVGYLPDLREDLPQKTVATLAGLGWIGKSALLVSPQHGPRLRLGTLITDMPLEPDLPCTRSRCGSCTLCVAACPARAVAGKEWTPGIPRHELLDTTACYSHLSRAKEALGRVQTCGLCLKVCPIGLTRPSRSE